MEIGEGVTSVGNMAFIGTKAESVNLPDSITKIGEDAFCCCTYLQNINIPCNTEAIGEGAFYSCYSLESVDIPPSLKIIEDLAFCRCTCLTELDIPDGVEKIENYAFEYCTRLVSVNISASVNEIGSDAFKECFCLESVFIANPDCVIYDASDTFCNETKKFILYGYEGSTAQAYAEKYGYNFVAIMLGDADFDGAVNSSDASLILADTLRVLCEDIDTRRRRIKKMRFELNQIRGYKICPKCDAEVNERFQFCGRCGARLPDPEDEDFTSLEPNDYYTESSGNFFNADSNNF